MHISTAQLYGHVVTWSDPFYPRPVLAFGYCRCLRVCVCVSVRQSWACPCDNSSTVQARITKFGSEMLKTLIKIPIVLWGDWRWSSGSNWTWKSKFTPFLACEFVRAISQYQIKWGFPNLDQKCILALLRSLLILGLVDLDLQFHF